MLYATRPVQAAGTGGVHLGIGAPACGTSAKGGAASDRERGHPVGVMGVEAAFAFGAEQVGDADGPLAQYQLQVMGLAFRADLADAAEAEYVKRLVFIVEVIDHHARIQLGEDQVFAVIAVTSA